jgi:5-methylcytosine-specific restriction protein A
MSKVRIKMLQPSIAVLKTSTAKALTTRTVRIAGKGRQLINARIMRRANGLCECDDCKLLAAPRVAHQVDHIVPLWEGGAESDANRQALNMDCHAKKTASEAKRRWSTR